LDFSETPSLAKLRETEFLFVGALVGDEIGCNGLLNIRASMAASQEGRFMLRGYNNADYEWSTIR
jgi:hypothetical protein